jgi:hypothetical protein
MVRFVYLIHHRLIQTTSSLLLNTQCTTKPSTNPQDHSSLLSSYPTLYTPTPVPSSPSSKATKGSLSTPTCTLPSLPMNFPYAHLYPCHLIHCSLSLPLIPLVPLNPSTANPAAKNATEDAMEVGSLGKIRQGRCE